MKDTNSIPVEFSCHAPGAGSVFVAGAFNEWQPAAEPLRLQPNGNWTSTLLLPLGRYEYKYVVDGQWGCEAGCDHQYQGCPKFVPNEFGTMNRVLEVI